MSRFSTQKTAFSEPDGDQPEYSAPPWARQGSWHVLVVAGLAVLLIAGSTSGCQQQNSTPSQRQAQDKVAVTAIHSALDSLRRHVETAFSAHDALASVSTADAILSVPGHDRVQGRDSVQAMLRAAVPAEANLDLTPTNVQILSSGQAHEVGTAALTFASGARAGQTTQATYFALLKQTDAGWKVDRASITTRTNASGLTRREGREMWDGTVLAIYVGGVQPFGKFINGSFHPVGPWQKELLAVHIRYVYYPEDASPAVLSVDSVGRSIGTSFPGTGTLDMPHAHGGIAGHVRVTDSLTMSSTEARMERFSRGRLAFSVPPDSTIDPATRLPAVDSTLSEAQREAIAEYVARRLTRQAAGEEAEIDSSDWQNVARRAAALLTPGPDSSNTLTLAVTSGDFNENGTLEYLVLAKRSFEKVVATLAEADSSQRTRFRGGCIGQMGDFHVEGASADSLALVCVRNQKQAAAFAGRMVDGHWKELFSQVLSRSRYSRGVSLQALDVNGDEVPELLSKQGQEGGARYEVFTYKDGTFKRVGYFGHGH